MEFFFTSCAWRLRRCAILTLLSVSIAGCQDSAEADGGGDSGNDQGVLADLGAVDLPSDAGGRARDLLDNDALGSDAAACAPTCEQGSCPAGSLCVSQPPAIAVFAATCLRVCTETQDCSTGEHCTDLANVMPVGRYCLDDNLPRRCVSFQPTCDVFQAPYCDGRASVRPYVPNSMVTCGMEHLGCGDGGCWDGGCQ